MVKALPLVPAAAGAHFSRPLPVTVLSGFLGAVKTTLLNHVCTETEIQLWQRGGTFADPWPRF